MKENFTFDEVVNLIETHLINNDCPWDDWFSKKYCNDCPAIVKKEERFVRGWADEDSWDIAGWFIGQMKCILPDFYKNNNGIPADMTEEEWDKIILRMIYLLDGMTDEGAAVQLFGSDANMTLERWRVAAEHKTKCTQEFLRLFTLYFNELWW